MQRRFIRPCEFCITEKPMLIETLVGSCVCVCLYNIRNGAAAMNHFLRDEPNTIENDDLGKFGTTATEFIVRELMTLDSVVGHYRAQILGGASVLDFNDSNRAIGEANVEAARKILRIKGIRIESEDIGGRKGRRVRFDTQKGMVMFRLAGEVGKRKQWTKCSMRGTK